MAISISDFRMAIRIDNSEAKNRLTELKDSISKLRAELKKLETDGQSETDEYKAKKKALDGMNESYRLLRKEAGLTGLTYTELRKGANQLRREMNNAIPGTEKWRELREDYLLTKNRMKELEVQARDTRFSVSKLADGFNRYATIGASVIASLTGVVLTARKCVDEYAQMEEAQSQVIKYTGMTKEETEALNESFKQMNTRTPREELNRLAGEAGKLGISSRDQVLEFVEAADMINVALGEDLGEDAVKNIGKLSQMFGDGSRTLKEDMLAIGSAVNQVAQSSSASEPYLVEFTARMGGVAKQADLAVTDVMGFASALDQNMLRSEMASTALQSLILKIYQEPAKYAKLAGMDVQEFVNLVNTDVNEALLQFLGTLGKMGGMAQMSPILKEMKLSGAEAAGVISALAGNIDQVRREQENANQAFIDGTSIINEFGVQNNTVQAGLDKAKKQFKDVRVELGEQLLPVMKYMVTTGSLTVKGLSAIVSILMEYKGEILTAATAVAAYTVATNASNIATKSYTVITKAATVATNLFSKATKASPWGVVFAGVTAAISYLALFRDETSKTTAVMESMNNISKRTGDEYDEQAAKIDSLTDIIKDNSLTIQQRKKAIEELKSIIPGYNAQLSEEGILTGHNTKAIQEYLTQLEKQIKLKAAQEELEDLYRKKRLNDRELKRLTEEEAAARAELNTAQTVASMRGSSLSTSGSRSLSSGLNVDVQSLQSQHRVIQNQLTASRDKAIELADAIKLVNSEIASSSVSNINKQDFTSTSNGSGQADQTDQATAEAALKSRYQNELNLLKEKYLNQQLTEDQYNKALYDAEVKYLASRKLLLEQFGKDSSEIQGQIYDKMISEASRLYEETQKVDKSWKSDLLASLEADYQKQVSDIKQAYLDGDIHKEADYQERLKELEADYLQQRKEMLVAYGEDVSAIDKQIQDNELKIKKDNKKKDRESGFGVIANTDDLDQQLNLLQAMYDADKTSYEEYQEWKTRLTQEHEDKRSQMAQSAFGFVSQAASSASQLIQALQDKEISQVERRYDKQIESAKAAGKDTTKLEEEKEAAISGIKKRYADKQFAANILQIISDTAVSVMRAWAELGPILGPIYAGLAAAQGAAQVVVAKQQRDEAKGLKSGGYSDEYVDGYTRKGNPDDVAGVIPVHKNEFVANHEAVANPSVKQFLDVFDVAQKKGTIRMLNTTQILEQVRTRSGRYFGGYTYDNPTRPSTTFSAELGQMTPEQRLQVIALLQENNRLLAVLCNKELVVDPRKVRDGIKRVETLERNVSR